MNVLITGGTRGIGLALVNKYLLEGYGVLCIARKISKDFIKHEKLLTFECDISDAQNIENLINFMKENSFQPNILINNVGVGYSEDFLYFPHEKIQEIIKTNIIGTILLTQKILKNFQKNLQNISFISSLAGRIGFKKLSIYTASKFAIEGFVQSLQQEIGSDIIITIIRPGIVDTDFFSYAHMSEYLEEENRKFFQKPDFVASCIFKAIKERKSDITIGNDKFFLFFKRFIPKKWEHKLLNLFIH